MVARFGRTEPRRFGIAGRRGLPALRATGAPPYKRTVAGASGEQNRLASGVRVTQLRAFEVDDLVRRFRPDFRIVACQFGAEFDQREVQRLLPEGLAAIG